VGEEEEELEVVGEVLERALRSTDEEAVSLFLREKSPSLRIFPEVEGDGSFVDEEPALEELVFPPGGTEVERGGAVDDEDAAEAEDTDERDEEVRGAEEGPEALLAGELTAKSEKKFLFLVFVERLVGVPSPPPEAVRLPG
jgi:hypothetical protein